MRRPRPIALAAAVLLLASACQGSPAHQPVPDGSTTVSTTPTSRATTPSTSSPATAAPGPELELIGHSILGRPLLATTIGSGPQRVYVIGSIHGDERTAAETSQALLDRLVSTPPEATVRWLVDANPDGTAAGTRDNAAGIDLNRNWPTGHIPGPFHGQTPVSEPETQALAADIAAFAPTLIVAMHSAREGPFVDHDGGAENLAHAFAAGASALRAWEVVPELAWDTPGSVGTHFGEGLGIPVVTVEGSRWDTPQATVPELSGGLDMLLAVLSGRTAVPHGPVCTDHAIGDGCTPLTRTVRQIVAEATGSTGATFLVKEAGGVVLAARRADWPLYPASTIKTLHLVHLLAEPGTSIESHFGASVPLPADGCTGDGVAGSESLGQLVERMMLDSDNEAANAIQVLIGLDGLAATATAAGMEDTEVHHGFGCGGPANDPANVSTAADLVRLYDAALTGSLLGADGRARLLDEMRDVTAAIVGGTDDPLAGARILAKDGWYGERRTIAGVAVVDPGRTIVFAVHVHTSLLPGPGSGLVDVAGRILREALVPTGG